MSLFTKHNYRAKKCNYSTLRGKSNVNGMEFCKKVKMESSKRTRVVLLARGKRAIRNYYEEQTKK
jgi:hypothetical protein